MPEKKRARPGLVELLRGAIQGSGLTLTELSKQSGVSPAQLSHFLRGKRTLTLPAAEKICDALGYTLAKVKTRPPKKKDRTKPIAD